MLVAIISLIAMQILMMFVYSGRTVLLSDKILCVLRSCPGLL